MQGWLPRDFWSDARHYQIAALSTLLIFNFGWLDFGARPLNSALALGGAIADADSCSRLYGLPSIDLRSPLITGLSLSLLLRADEPWLHAVAGVIAHRLEVRAAHRRQAHLESGRLRHRGAAVHLQRRLDLARRNGARRSGSSRCSRFFAILVLHAARRSDMAIFFLGSHAALLFARAWWLGDPLAIPIHQLQSGSLLIFAFFMISDPRTSPDSRLGRFLFAASVATPGPLHGVLHADAAGALRRADRALPAHPSHRPRPAGRTICLEPAGQPGSLPMTKPRRA